MPDTIDIADAKADDPEALRDALVEQFAHLADEVTALRTVVDGLPDAILEGRPEEAPRVCHRQFKVGSYGHLEGVPSKPP